jgi:hypothetical protein
MEDAIELLAKKKAPVIQGVAKLIAIRVGVRFRIAHPPVMI